MDVKKVLDTMAPQHSELVSVLRDLDARLTAQAKPAPVVPDAALTARVAALEAKAKAVAAVDAK
jgi:hypothetical protein